MFSNNVPETNLPVSPNCNKVKLAELGSSKLDWAFFYRAWFSKGRRAENDKVGGQRVILEETLWDEVNILFLTERSPTNFSVQRWFSNSIIPSRFVSWHRDNLFLSLFIWSYFSSVWIHGSSFNCYHYLIRCSNCLRFGQWRPHRIGSYVLLTSPHGPLNTSCFLVQKAVPGPPCGFRALALKSYLSPRSPGPFWCRKVFRNPDLGTRCSFCCVWLFSGLPSRQSQGTGRRNTNTHGHKWCL